MKFNRLLLVLLIINLFWLIKNPTLVFGKENRIPSQLMAYVGKSFIGLGDPNFLSYEKELKQYLVNRVNKKFGLNLSLFQYSGFDLLEIESLLKCKKSNELSDTFLKMFPKGK